MSPLWTAWTIVAAVTGTGLAAYALLARAIDRPAPRPAGACPDPALVLAVVHAETATEWLVCDSPACRLLSTPHTRTGPEAVQCLWCQQVTSEVARG